MLHQFKLLDSRNAFHRQMTMIWVQKIIEEVSPSKHLYNSDKEKTELANIPKYLQIKVSTAGDSDNNTTKT